MHSIWETTMRRNMDMQIGALTMSMAHSHSSAMEPSPGLRHLDPDTDFKVRRITSCINEAIHMAANEPSLGLYRIQEHVHRTAPQLAVKKKDLKANNKQILGTSYDLNLSMDVVDSMRKISNFTRIQEALKTAIETKRKLNLEEEQGKARRELEMKNAKIANRSISCNEPAEGYICPVCYFALTGQEELISHWQEHHNINDCDNDLFHEVEMPVDENNIRITDVTLEGDDDMTVIISPKERRGVSEGEDVVKEFLHSGCNYVEQNETSASEASSSGIEYRFDMESSSNELIKDDVKHAEAIVDCAGQAHVRDVGSVLAEVVDQNAGNDGDALRGSIMDDSDKFDDCVSDNFQCVESSGDNLHETSADSMQEGFRITTIDDGSQIDTSGENFEDTYTDKEPCDSGQRVDIDLPDCENSRLADIVIEHSPESAIEISEKTSNAEENQDGCCSEDIHI